MTNTLPAPAPIPDGKPQPIHGYRLLQLPQICHYRGASKSQIYKEIQDGLLPRILKFGRQSLMVEGELSAVLAMRAAGASDKEVRGFVATLFEQRQQMRASVIG
jgi:predicted DNA-binding transcriptional regulator AlpA